MSRLTFRALAFRQTSDERLTLKTSAQLIFTVFNIPTSTSVDTIHWSLRRSIHEYRCKFLQGRFILMEGMKACQMVIKTILSQVPEILKYRQTEFNSTLIIETRRAATFIPPSVSDQTIFVAHPHWPDLAAGNIFYCAHLALSNYFM